MINWLSGGASMFCHNWSLPFGGPFPLLSYNILKALVSGFRFEVQRYALKINPVLRNDSDTYACRAENQHGEAWLNFTLTVLGMLQIVNPMPPGKNVYFLKYFFICREVMYLWCRIVVDQFTSMLKVWACLLLRYLKKKDMNGSVFLKCLLKIMRLLHNFENDFVHFDLK